MQYHSSKEQLEENFKEVSQSDPGLSKRSIIRAGKCVKYLNALGWPSIQSVSLWFRYYVSNNVDHQLNSADFNLAIRLFATDEEVGSRGKRTKVSRKAYDNEGYDEFLKPLQEIVYDILQVGKKLFMVSIATSRQSGAIERANETVQEKVRVLNLMLEWELPNSLVVWIVYQAIFLINMTPYGNRIDSTPAHEIMQRSLQHEARFRFGETVYAVNPNSFISGNALKDRHIICIFLTLEENSFVLFNLTSGQLIRREPKTSDVAQVE